MKAPESLDLPLSADALGGALRRERLRLYGANLWSALGANVLIAVLVAAVMYEMTVPATLLPWLALLALSLVLRVVVGQLPGEGLDEPRRARARLWQLRVVVLATGAVWGLAGVWLFPPQDFQHQVFLAFVLAGLAAGSLTLTSFDLGTALGFAALALGPLTARLATTGQGAAGAVAVMMGLFVSILALTGWRAQRSVRYGVETREAEARRARVLLDNQQRLQQVSDELARNSQALAMALDSMDQGILSLGADGRTNFYNRRLSELTDLPESFLVTRPTMDEIARYQVEHGHYGPDLGLVDEQVRDALRRWLDGAREALPPHYFRRTPDGRTLEINTRHPSGGGLVRTFTDVTAYFEAQQRLRDSEAQARKLALVAAYTNDAVAITDPDRRIEWVNEGFTRLTGYTLQEATGRIAAELLRGPATDAAEIERLDAQLAGEGRCFGELLHYAKDGRAYWFAVETQAIRDESGTVRQYVSIGRDVTARHRAEQALHAARDDAERASRAKSTFLSSMSHELRTPMNAILGFAQLLQADRTAALGVRQRAHVEQILRAGAHLLELIDDVLDLSRVESGRQLFEIGPVAVGPLIVECLELMRPIALTREVRLPPGSVVADGTFVAADRVRLKQVLLNLLSNAVKYNQHGGSVVVGAAADGDGVRITVTDTGQGLDAEQQARLFRAFERLGAELLGIQGAGIGLALSKQLVERMSGRVGVDSEPGRGSTFWVWLPAATPQAAAARAAPATAAPQAPPVPAAASSTPRTVLYVEDNPVNVLLMEAALEAEPGVRLLTAQTPEHGLELARAERPTLILLDIQLPGLDGFEVLQRLRASDEHRDTPVVAVSANALPQDIERALGAGFDAYLAKPIDLAQLISVVRQRWPGREGAAARG